ncbi:sterile alpha motif domain-containing protein 9-like [Bufo gargarizans]|uniref:sterile alpha motif domain-containing protein 9-like n=1 Tax=Bufo gargarizans TaxID=30331 RepID=UPI001CF0E4F3|nr:sterile alpha motif domain-containing protein 9-like [Bufo gargarizans]XP_044149878.1 sterile alpha motif domain-containing protein 9-like [Bufo gargarizans]
MTDLSNLPNNVHEWTKDHVKLWVTGKLKLDSAVADILFDEDVTGNILKDLTKEDFYNMGIKKGPVFSIVNNLKALAAQAKVIDQNRPRNISGQQAQQTNDATPPVDKKDINPVKTEETSHKELGNPESISSDQVQGYVRVIPHPFDTTSGIKSYTKHHLLPPESGTFNYIDPIHEYKEFTNTSKATKEDKKMKFCNEVFRFAAACMNARTNGTIHFGVRDDPHGEIIGVPVANSETYVQYFDQLIGTYFEKNQLELAKKCIRPPRFVSVLHEQNTRSDLVVIEVDVVPAHAYCKSQIFNIFQYVCTESVNKVDKKWRKSKETYCFLREGGSSKDMLANLQKDSSMASLFSAMEARDNDRKRAEDERKKKQKCSQVDGFKLSHLLTGNRNSLDNSYYKWYILVANKCNESHKNHLGFIQELNWFAILDFDPESFTNGLCKVYQEERKPNLHFPHQYPKIENFTQENIEELKLYQQPSWIFCNGRLELQSENYQPLNYSTWQEEKADDVRNLVSIFSKKDIMEQGKFLVVFLLLSTVEDPMDPMNEVFRAFFQKLKSMADILCICGNEETFQRWKDLQARLMGRSGEEMEERCIYNLDIENLNGTILRLKSATRSGICFLPSHGGSSTILQRKDEDLMTSLDILCANECQDTEIESNTLAFNEFLKTHEEHFYRGGKATWWNFYFSAKQYTGPFIKRDVHEELKEQVESWSKCEKQRSVKIITLFHHPGCGGTTTAMHILWELRETFRCAVLNRKTDNLSDVAKEVVSLAVHGSPNGKDGYPVLLLVDDYNDEESASILQNNIQSAIAERYIRFETPVVIILNCVRSQNPEESAKSNCTSSVALTYKLSEVEKRAFATKLKEMEMQHENPDNFYSFMIMKNNFEKSYIETTVRNTLKGLNSASKTTQLISFLALLNKYVPDSTISASMCEEFLGITAKKTYWRPESIEDTVGSYSTILIRTEVEECGRYEGLRIIHKLIADQCIEELKTTYDIQQSRIMLNMLQTNVFHDTGIGREFLIQNMQSMLVTRYRKEHGAETNTLFSPLIEDIQKTEGSSLVEHVLKEGTKRFNKNPFICQALARHFYIRDQNYTDAFVWAEKAVSIASTNSFILDTLGQTYKNKLKDMMDSINKDNPISPEQLDDLLKIAYTASKTFKECQEQTEKTEIERSEFEKSKGRHYSVYNTAGYLGQIEVCLYTVEILLYLPWFNSKDSLSRKHLTQYLSGKWDISVDNASEDYEEFLSVLRDHRPFLIKLKSCLKKAFDFFQDYYVYMKLKNVNKESTEFKIRVRVSGDRKKYNRYFYDRDLMQITNEEDQRKKSTLLRKEEYRAGLEKYKADRFSGILEYLTDHEMGVKKMESIVKTYNYLLENSTYDSQILLRDKQNLILANIVLHCISPKSTEIKPVETLEKHLKEIMNNIGLDHKYPEPYFLASLLFWPQNSQKLDSTSKLIAEYVISMKKSFRGKYRHMCSAKQPLTHFYLGKHSGLKRIIHKGKIEQYFSDVPVSDLNALWMNGDIWKEAAIKDLLLRVNGRTEEDDKIYVECSDKISIPVRPVYLGQLRSGRSIERVTFYLGFSLDGLIAYDIEIMK